MARLRFKEYLEEYYKYPRSFSDEVVDKEEDGLTKVDGNRAEVRRSKHNKRECEKVERGDGEEDYSPCGFRHWMEISIAGEN